MVGVCNSCGACVKRGAVIEMQMVWHGEMVPNENIEQL